MTNAFNGFWGKARWLLTGGVAGGIQYDWDGTPSGLAPLMGTPPLEGSLNGINIFKAAKGGVTVFRAVDAMESAIIRNTGQFSLQEGGVEAKYFAKSLEDAHWYGQRLYPNGYSIIKGTVKSPINISQYWFQHVDIGAYVFPKEILQYITPH